MRSKSIRLIVALAVATLAASVGLPAIIHAKSPAEHRITFQEPPEKVVMQDLPPRSKSGKVVSQGDRLVISGPLETKSHKRLGTFSGNCTAVGAAKAVFKASLLCTVDYQVAAGQIVASGLYKLDGSGRLPIVGGSGAYAGARGVLTSGRPAKGFDDADTLTLSR